MGKIWKRFWKWIDLHEKQRKGLEECDEHIKGNQNITSFE